MGAMSFMIVVSGQSTQDAFNRAVEHACWEHGHGGYTGTIAEKSDFVELEPAATEDDARERADTLLRSGDSRVASKWGPCGCIPIQPDPRDKKSANAFVFFGWASS